MRKGGIKPTQSGQWSTISLNAYASPPEQLFAKLRVNFDVHCKMRHGPERVGDINPVTYPKRHILSAGWPS